MKLINRDDYLNKIINVIGTPDIKVITGIYEFLNKFYKNIIKTKLSI